MMSVNYSYSYSYNEWAS